jgi:hypothetical protein
MKTPDAEWVVEHGSLGRAFAVRGFLSVRKALDHVDRHFLEPDERWEQLVEDPSPRESRRVLAQVQCARGAHPQGCLEAAKCEPHLSVALSCYVVAVQRECAGIVDAAVVLRKGRGALSDQAPYECIVIASAGGVYAVFALGDPSHLATAFRPSALEGHGKPKLHHFRQGAMRSVARALLESETLKARLGSAGRGKSHD